MLGLSGAAMSVALRGGSTEVDTSREGAFREEIVEYWTPVTDETGEAGRDAGASGGTHRMGSDWSGRTAGELTDVSRLPQRSAAEAGALSLSGAVIDGGTPADRATSWIVTFRVPSPTTTPSCTSRYLRAPTHPQGPSMPVPGAAARLRPAVCFSAGPLPTA
jgi:uncharacterized protein with LGFP repeats